MKPELLAPVGDWETLAAAIKAGADSVYFGIKWINMRSASARNFDISELNKLMEKLHENKVKGYLTLNTLIYDHELDKVEKILKEVKKAKVDAVIATDLAIIQMCNERDIEVHTSTQLSTSNYEAIKFLSKFAPRIVLARECTLDQIKEMKKKIKKDKLNFKGKEIELETFIHGALCVAYSGRCFMSQFHNRLSANRGQCLQECRRRYNVTDVEDSRRSFILEGEYVMSPKDLCTLPILDKLVESGIDVFKIEGRAKGPEYVYEVTKSYRTAIDLINKNKFTKKEMMKLVNKLHKVFNRGFSTNFFLGTPTNDSWAKFYGSIAEEKKIKLGKVTQFFPRLKVVAVEIEENQEIKNGDEICFIGPTTGYYRTKIKDMRIDDNKIKKAKKGDEISFKVKEKLRNVDKVYLIRNRDIDKEEQNIIKQLEKIGIHKPFKHTKQKGMK